MFSKLVNYGVWTQIGGHVVFDPHGITITFNIVILQLLACYRNVHALYLCFDALQRYIYAFCGTINILCSQAMGARSGPLVGEWAQLGCLLAALLTVPTFLSYWYCEQILRLFGATPHIVESDK